MTNVSTNLLRTFGLAIVGAIGAAAHAQIPADQLPRGMEGVGINEKLGETIPLDLPFTDEKGEIVTLGELFRGDRPVILTPVFYECPMLCTLVLNGLVDGLNDMDEWSIGNEFDIVTFSFKEGESYTLADVKKRAYLSQYRPESHPAVDRRQWAADGWHFLVADQTTITALTESIGYTFNILDDGNIAHTASIVFLTPDGRISRYMNDVMFEPRDLKYALIESSEGTIGAPLEKFALFMCFQYDPESGSYVWAAWKVMRLGGAITMLTILVAIIWLWRKGPRNPLANTEADVAMGGIN